MMHSKVDNDTASLPSYEHLASGIVLATSTSLIFVAACVLLVLYYWRRVGRALVETRIGIVMLFLGALLTTLLSIGFYVHQTVYGIYKLFLVIFVGVVFLWTGTIVLFNNPVYGAVGDEYGRPLIPVGHTNGSMGIIIWVIALPLCALEMFFAIGGVTSRAPIYASGKLVCLVQKLVQAAIYHFSLRYKIPRSSMRKGCSWFLKTISLFNFALWIDSIVTAHNDNAFVRAKFGNGFSIVKSTYNTLIIDYRLLCSLLFLEHALEIEGVAGDDSNERHHQIEDASIHDDNSTVQTQPETIDVRTIHYSGYGYVIGLVCISVQLVNGLQYLNVVGTWTSIFPILCNIVIVIAGLLLVKGESSSSLEDGNRWRETESKAIDVMIGLMGAVGFVYRMMKASCCLIWATGKERAELKRYLFWNSAKETIRAISVIFQLYLFVKVGPYFCQEARNRRRSICHLLVPVVMLGLLSTFISCIIDQYNGDIEYLINHSKVDPSMTSFFNAAAPIHLGFSLHMFLHFYIIKRKMRKTKDFVLQSRRVKAGERKPMNSNSEEREPLLSIIEDR